MIASEVMVPTDRIHYEDGWEVDSIKDAGKLELFLTLELNGEKKLYSFEWGVEKQTQTFTRQVCKRWE